MHSIRQPVSQSSVGYVVQFCSFIHWHLIFCTLNVGICQCIMGRPFWGSEFCSAAEFVEVLLQKTGKETHTKKSHKNVFYFKTPSYKKTIFK